MIASDDVFLAAGGRPRSSLRALLTTDRMCPSTPSTHTQYTHIHTALARSFANRFHSGGYLNRDDVTARVMEVVKKFDKVEQSKVTPTSNFKSDLGLDSLDETEVVMAFEEEFNIDIPDAEADKIKSLEDAINFVTADPNAK